MKVLIPFITEKSYRGFGEGVEGAKTYTFKVRPEMDKQYIKSLVEKEFKVNVEDIRIINLPGKVRRFRKSIGKTQVRCKAIVRLKNGQNIEAFEAAIAKSSDDKE